MFTCRRVPGAGGGIFEGVEPGSEVPVVIKGKAVTIDLIEGEHRVLKLEAAEGSDPTEPGWAFTRQFLVRVVKVVDGAALLE